MCALITPHLQQVLLHTHDVALQTARHLPPKSDSNGV